MAETTIAWTDYTFNPWWGCTRVSPGCEHCYAESFSHRLGLDLWGPTGGRRFFDTRHWAEPVQWWRRRLKGDPRHRVFCASMADVFEDLRTLDWQRDRLWELIGETSPQLTWQLLTKRPENVLGMVPPAWLESWPANVWMLTTAEDQRRADERIPLLLRIPAKVRGVSAEPLLGPLDLRPYLHRNPEARVCPRCLYASNIDERCPNDGTPLGPDIAVDWVICGGESGAKARPMEMAWAWSLAKQCHRARAAFFMKQAGSNVRDRNDVGFDADSYRPEDLRAWPSVIAAEDRVEHNLDGFRDEYQGAPVRVRLRDYAGGDPAEWPAGLRVREWPA